VPLERRSERMKRIDALERLPIRASEPRVQRRSFSLSPNA